MKSIFVSSTFKDMQAERDVLKSKVQPMLNNLAREYGESISFADLRWGVDTSEMTEEEQNRQVLSVCMDEIDRSRPYMIVLLGERYGYMPGPETIKAEADKRPEMHLPELDISVTQLEIEYGALSTKESLAHTYFYFRELDTNDLPEGFIETSKEYIDRLKSLKERIKTLAGDHVRFYKAHWNGSSVEGLDEFAELVKNDMQAEFLPVWQEMSRLNIVEKTKRIQDAYIAERSLAFVPEDKRPAYSSKEDYESAEYLLNMYTNDLKDRRDVKKYKNYLKKIKRSGIMNSINSWFEATRSSQEYTRIVAKILLRNEKIVHGHKYPALVLKGAKGSGRTMYVIHLCELIRKIGFRVIEIHAGTTSLFSSSIGVLLYTIYRIEEIMGRKHKYLNESTSDAAEVILNTDVDNALDYAKELIQDFSSNEEYYMDGHIVVAIDGVENLRNDKYKEMMSYVSECVTDQVKVLLTADESTYIPPMDNIMTLPVPNQEEKESYVEGVLLYHGKQFGSNVKNALLEKELSSNPLYLYFAVSRLSMMDAEDFRSISEKGDGIEAINDHLIELIGSFPNDLKDMSLTLLEAASEKITKKMMKCASLIALSRNGLRLDDLLSIMMSEGESITQLDFIQFVNFMSDLFIIREDGSYDFMHSCVKDALLEKIEDKEAYHKKIAGYIKMLPDEDSLKKGEYMWHSLNAANYIDVISYACDLIEGEGDTGNAAQDLAAWAKTADQETMDKLFEILMNVGDANLTKGFLSFIAFHCFDEFGYTKADDDAIDRIGNAVTSLSAGYGSDTKDVLSEIYTRLGLRHIDTPNRIVLRRSYEYLNKALEMTNDEERSIRCKYGLLQVSDNTDEDDIKEHADEYADDLIKHISKETDDVDFLRTKAKADLAYGNHFVATGIQKNVITGANAIIDALNIYDDVIKKERWSMEDRYIHIDACLGLAEAAFVFKTPKELERVQSCYNLALREARSMRDRYKDVRARTAFVNAYAHQSVYDYKRSVQKYSIKEYYSGRDASSALDDCQSELQKLYEEMGTDRSIFLNYWTQLQLGYAYITYINSSADANNAMGAVSFGKAEDYLNILKSTVPYYERLHCECMRGIAYSRFYSSSGEELNKAVDYLNMTAKVEAELAKSGKFEDILEKARFNYTMGHIERYSTKKNEDNRRLAIRTVKEGLDTLEQAARKYNTVDAWLEYGKALLVIGEAYDDIGELGSEKDYETSKLYFKDVKEIYEMIKKNGAQSFAAEIFGSGMILALDKFNEFTDRFKKQ